MNRILLLVVLLLTGAAPQLLPPDPPSEPLVYSLSGPTDSLSAWQLSWTVPPVDATHPVATFYHWQVVLGDTTPKTALTGLAATGVTYGYTNAVAYNYPARIIDTVRIARCAITCSVPIIDSVGPYRLAVQAATGVYGVVGAVGAGFALGPYSVSAPFWIRKRLAASLAAPNAPLGLAFNELP